MRLESPEPVIVDEVIELLGDVGHSPFVRACGLDLLNSLLGQVLQLDAIGLRLLSKGRGPQVDRDAGFAAKGGQSVNVYGRWNIHGKRSEERREGQECASTCRSRWSQSSTNKQNTIYKIKHI